MYTCGLKISLTWDHYSAFLFDGLVFNSSSPLPHPKQQFTEWPFVDWLQKQVDVHRLLMSVFTTRNKKPIIVSMLNSLLHKTFRSVDLFINLLK